MADGHLNKCKECARADVKANRQKNIDYYREYDRDRGNRQQHGYVRKWREEYPNKYRAHVKLNNELRAGSLTKKPCEICGAENVHGHHDDYLRTLDVRWLCPVHHKQWHDENGEGKNP